MILGGCLFMFESNPCDTRGREMAGRDCRDSLPVRWLYGHLCVYLYTCTGSCILVRFVVQLQSQSYTCRGREMAGCEENTADIAATPTGETHSTNISTPHPVLRAALYGHFAQLSVHPLRSPTVVLLCHQERLLIYCQTPSVSAAHAGGTHRRLCCY